MLNRYPIGTYALIACVIALACVYALPNLYAPDAAVQIVSVNSRISVDRNIEAQALRALQQQQIDYKGSELLDGSLLIRLQHADQQLKAKAQVQRVLSDDFVVALNLAPTTPQWLQKLGGTPMSLGLDLAGGVHFLMEVDMDSYLQNRIRDHANQIRRLFREQKLHYSTVDIQDNRRIAIRFNDAAVADQATHYLRQNLPEFTRELQRLPDHSLLTLSLSDTELQRMQDYAVRQNLTTMSNRVNELGVSEPIVQRQGQQRIVVELPGIQDTASAKRILGKSANLEFRLQARSGERSETFSYRSHAGTEQLEPEVIITGDSVTHAQASYDENGQPQVNIDLDNSGGARMNQVTRMAVQRRMAVIFVETKTQTNYRMVDGQQQIDYTPITEKGIISLATIQTALGTSFRITGLDSPQEASDLALFLRAGALAAPMYFVEERTIGPSLGQQNIEQGIESILIGFALVIVFMLAVYRRFGLFATLALALNVVLIIAPMSLLGATLTLPGMAGIVLTVGMAVDANVLIFSRIRGYQRAFTTILDANLTTLIVALILYAIGTGPVKGFAVTLSFGILTSMFTAIVVTRALTNLSFGGKTLSDLPIWPVLMRSRTQAASAQTAVPRLAFMAWRTPALAASALLIAISIVTLSVKGLNLGLDFSGGAQIEIGYQSPADIEAIRQQLQQAGYNDAVVQYFGNNTDVLIRLQQDANPDLGESVLTVLQQQRADASLRRNEFVGPQVSEELRDQGGLGLLLAMIIVMLYVSVRFQFKFALGSVIALVHDVLIVLGLFALLGLSFDLTVLAALLAIIGYSLNDSIVVSDRIRENFRLIRRDDAAYIIDVSLTQVLGRTLATSGTTLLVLLALAILGGELIRGFSIALIIGIIVGTYSSVFVTASTLLITKLSTQDMLPPTPSKETEEEIPDWLTRE